MNEKSIIAGCCELNILREKLFLQPRDLMYIMGVSENTIYKYLRHAPFRTAKVGRRIVIFSNSFWAWYDGKVA